MMDTCRIMYDAKKPLEAAKLSCIGNTEMENYPIYRLRMPS